MPDRDKHQVDEYKKHPMANVKDSYDRAEMGDLRPLSRMGWWGTGVLIVIGIVLLYFFNAS